MILNPLWVYDDEIKITFKGKNLNILADFNVTFTKPQINKLEFTQINN